MLRFRLLKPEFRSLQFLTHTHTHTYIFASSTSSNKLVSIGCFKRNEQPPFRIEIAAITSATKMKNTFSRISRFCAIFFWGEINGILSISCVQCLCVCGAFAPIVKSKRYYYWCACASMLHKSSRSTLNKLNNFNQTQCKMSNMATNSAAML